MSGDPAMIDALHSAVADLQTVQREIAAWSSAIDENWRRGLVECRRRLQQRTQGVATLLETLDLGVDDTRQIRAVFGRMRSLVALHQANWPAVSIDRGDAGYHQSLVNVRAANRDFATAIAAFLPRPRPATRVN